MEQRKASAAMRHKERLSTVRAAEQDMKEELQEKIQLKQEEAAKRHAEYLGDIRQKAWEMSLLRCGSDEKVPNITNYQIQKKCEVCNAFIKSEVHLSSHLQGKQHQEELAKKVDRPRRGSRMPRKRPRRLNLNWQPKHYNNLHNMYS